MERTRTGVDRVNRTIEITGHGRGLHEITSMVSDVVRDAENGAIFGLFPQNIQLTV